MLSTLRPMIALAPAVLVASCVAYEPAPLDRDAELAALRATTLDGFVVAHARPGDDGAAAPARFDLADGLDEDELVAVALTLNPAIRAKRLEIGEADALLVGAGLWPNPSLGASWREGLAGAAGHTLDADLLVDLLQPLRRAARVDAATARRDEVRAGIVAEEWRLVRDVRMRRLDVVAAESALAVLRDEAELRGRAMDAARRRRESGEGTELDVAAANLDAAEVRREVRAAETEAASARRALNALLGLPPDYALRLSDVGDRQSVVVFEDVSDDDLDRRVLAGRFELRALEAAHAKAEHELRLAVAKQFPSLSVGLSYERDSSDEHALGPAAEIELPLFDRNQGEIAEKANARERARADWVAEMQRLRAEAYDARARLRAARLEVETQETEVLPLVRRNQELIESAFESHQVGVLDRVSAMERALKARRTFGETVVAYRRAVIDLETATGMPLARSAASVVREKK